MTKPNLIAVIYVNPIEYHGRHMPLKTDYWISHGMNERIRTEALKRRPDLVFEVMETIDQGCDPAPGPGTEYTSFSVLVERVTEATRRALERKPAMVLYQTFHGAPRHAAAIEKAAEFARAHGVPAYNPFNIALDKLCGYDPSWAKPISHWITDETIREKWVAKLPTDFHGGLFETSVLLAVHPETVRQEEIPSLPDCPDRNPNWVWKSVIGALRIAGLKRLSDEVALAADAVAWESLPVHYGYTGWPRFSRAELGESLIGVLLPEMTEQFFAVLEQRDPGPKPVMQWTVQARRLVSV